MQTIFEAEVGRIFSDLIFSCSLLHVIMDHCQMIMSSIGWLIIEIKLCLFPGSKIQNS